MPMSTIIKKHLTILHNKKIIALIILRTRVYTFYTIIRHSPYLLNYLI